MPWCPICKNEYKDGITSCSDCGCDLVEKETDIRKKVTFGQAEEMEELSDFLKSNGIEYVSTSFDEQDKVTELSVAEKDLYNAERMISIYLKQKQTQQKYKDVINKNEVHELVEETQRITRPSSVYENSASKADDHKSSAYTLLFVGIAGIVVIILGIAEILPIHLYGTSKYLIYGIMGSLFILFIIMGLVSMKSYRIYEKKAASENTLQNTMKEWCIAAFRQEDIDSAIFTVEKDMTEEEKYFKRVKFMKEKLCDTYYNLDEAFLDHFVDEIYADIFKD